MKWFWWGVGAGFLTAAVIASAIIGTMIAHNKDREIIRYVELQQEIEALREDYVNRDTADFLDELPDVRRAAEGATAEFDRKRDEILQRFRSGLADR